MGKDVRKKTNLECWGSDESWDLWREDSKGGRKNNRQWRRLDHQDLAPPRRTAALARR